MQANPFTLHGLNFLLGMTVCFVFGFFHWVCLTSQVKSLNSLWCWLLLHPQHLEWCLPRRRCLTNTQWKGKVFSMTWNKKWESSKQRWGSVSWTWEHLCLETQNKQNWKTHGKAITESHCASQTQVRACRVPARKVTQTKPSPLRVSLRVPIIGPPPLCPPLSLFDCLWNLPYKSDLIIYKIWCRKGFTH